MLCDFPGSVLVVTHDRYFLDRVATSMLVFEGEGRVGQYLGDYGNYSRLRRERSKLGGDNAQASPAATGTAKANETKSGTKPVKLTYKEERELSEMEAAIELAEKEVSRLQALLADPELYRRDPGQAAKLGSELVTAQTRVQKLMDRWQELESKRVAFEPKR
jgi:ATP-binding cassette subfamily F protein uup